jgi:hypothetical protein
VIFPLILFEERSGSHRGGQHRNIKEWTVLAGQPIEKPSKTIRPVNREINGRSESKRPIWFVRSFLISSILIGCHGFAPWPNTFRVHAVQYCPCFLLQISLSDLRKHDGCTPLKKIFNLSSPQKSVPIRSDTHHFIYSSNERSPSSMKSSPTALPPPGSARPTVGPPRRP